MHLWGGSAEYVLDTSVHAHEAHYLKLDCSKAKIKLSWHPKLSIESTLERIVGWYKAYIDKEDMRAYTLQEIEQYESL